MMLGLGNQLTKASAPDAPFTVDTLSEVITWLKADTGITETSSSSGVVARWRDNIGEADWVSNESGKQPSILGTGTSARLRWDGGDRMYQKEYDWDSSTDGFAFDFPHDVFDVMNSGGSGGFSFFVVFEFSGSLGLTLHTFISENHFVDDGTPGGTFTARTDIAGSIAIYTKGDFLALSGIEGGSGTVYNNSTSSGTEFVGSSSAQTELDGTSKFLFVIEYEGGTNGAITLRVNGANKPLTINNSSYEAGQITVGSLGAGSSGIRGDVYELINCSSKLSSENRGLVEDYLMDRHGIS